jgi:hypothetical protein
MLLFISPAFSFVNSFFIILLLYWGYIVTFTKVLTIYQSWICPLHHSISSFPHSWNSFSRLIFSFLYMNTQYFYHIHPPTPFLEIQTQWYQFLKKKTLKPTKWYHITLLSSTSIFWGLSIFWASGKQWCRKHWQCQPPAVAQEDCSPYTCQIINIHTHSKVATMCRGHFRFSGALERENIKNE